jgi:hypothetical protein
MPGMDRTGPLGQGPLTGRGLGPCGAGAGFRRGFGRGMGRGFGFRRFVMTPQTMELTPANEKQILKQELKEIELEKKEIEKRLKELKE